MGEVVTKNHVIFEIVSRRNRRGPYIKKDNLQWSERNKCGLRKWLLMTFIAIIVITMKR